MSRTVRWMLGFVFTVAAMVGSFIAAYNLTVWGIDAKPHHDLSDMGPGFVGIGVGLLAAVLGAVAGGYVAARWITPSRRARRRSSSI